MSANKWFMLWLSGHNFDTEVRDTSGTFTEIKTAISVYTVTFPHISKNDQR